MHIETLYAPRRSTLIRFVATALLLTLAACSQLSDTRRPPPDKNAPRAQLSIGYSLLYQEADGIPKLKWIFMFKDKPEEMGRVTGEAKVTKIDGRRVEFSIRATEGTEEIGVGTHERVVLQLSKLSERMKAKFG